MDTQQAFLLAAIAGMVELIKRLRARDFWTAVTIVSAALVGGLFAFLGYLPGQDFVHGMVSGLGVSGVMTTLGAIGNKSVTSPTSAIDTKG